jgi:hypothetical protein
MDHAVANGDLPWLPGLQCPVGRSQGMNVRRRRLLSEINR